MFISTARAAHGNTLKMILFLILIVSDLTEDFWYGLDKLVNERNIVIDRPKGMEHPTLPDIAYNIDYGYLEGTSADDGSGVDVWMGSMDEKKVTAVINTIDLYKMDTEVKILMSCTPEEQEEILGIHNSSRQHAIIVKR
jgi:inorganic pyrophosphatase